MHKMREEFDLLSIGNFAHVGQVSIVTLRFIEPGEAQSRVEITSL